MLPNRIESYRVVVADDDPCFRETLLEMLEPDFQTYPVESGHAAIEVIEQIDVDLALFDMHMPDVTGLEAIRQIKQVKRDLPCLLMTAKYSEQIRQQADRGSCGRSEKADQSPTTGCRTGNGVAKSSGHFRDSVFTHPSASVETMLSPDS